MTIDPTKFTKIADFDQFPEEVRLKWLTAGLKAHLRTLQKKGSKMTKTRANEILKEMTPEELKAFKASL